MPKKKTLARKLFVGILMEATDDRVQDMHDVLNQHIKDSPVVMTVLRTVPFIDDLVEIINSEYKYRSNKKKKK